MTRQANKTREDETGKILIENFVYAKQGTRESVEPSVSEVLSGKIERYFGIKCMRILSRNI